MRLAQYADTRITGWWPLSIFSVTGAAHAGGGLLMAAVLLAWTSKSPVSCAVARLCPAAPVPDLTTTNLSHELQGTMPGIAVRLRRLHDASTNQGTARRWRDQG
jgi:hypothetical protein